MKNITILWWFWNWNLWDDTILYNEINLLKDFFWKDINILVFSNNPKNIEKNFIWIKSDFLTPIAFYRFYKFLNIFYLIRFIKILKNTDLLILWWWGFFSDKQFFAIMWWLRYIKLFKKLWSKIIWFWMWAWPFFYSINKKILKNNEKYFDLISLRDEESLNNFLEIWFNKNKLLKFIDPAFFTKNRNQIKTNSIWFVLHSNKDFFIKEIKKVLKNTDYNIKLIITEHLDIKLNKEILSSIKNKRVELIIKNNFIDIIDEISKLDFIVSQRLHWSIIAFTQKVPFLNIYYHHKWKELWNFLNIEDFSINIKDIEKENIISYIENKDKFKFKNIDLEFYKKLFINNLKEKWIKK